MGYKFRKDKWYDYPLMLPTLCIAPVIAAVIGIVNHIRKRK
jgi:hypothetical protein